MIYENAVKSKFGLAEVKINTVFVYEIKPWLKTHGTSVGTIVADSKLKFKQIFLIQIWGIQ